jgi:hypothetical protein
VLTNWRRCRGTQALVTTTLVSFYFNWFIFLTHLATPQDTGTTPQGNLHKKIISVSIPSQGLVPSLSKL